MTVNSIPIAYLITAILKALVKRLVTSRLDLLWLGLNLYFPTLNLYLWGPLVRFSGTRKSLITLGGLVSCDANITSSELPLSLPRNYFKGLTFEHNNLIDCFNAILFVDRNEAVMITRQIFYVGMTILTYFVQNE